MLEADGLHWLPIKDGDPRGRALYERHYSSRKSHGTRETRQARLFVGPGQKRVYLTADGLALWAWRRFIDDSGQRGVNCAIFRNEGATRSSDLVREAVEIAWRIWPGERLYTYVAPNAIRSANPGYCFKVAGWRLCGRTKGGKHILEMLPTLPEEATHA